MSDAAQAPLFADDDDVIFAAETPETERPDPSDLNQMWKIMIVDDDEEVHKITKLALEDFSFEDRGLTFISAYSGEEAEQLIQEHPDTALILLDVVMETDQAGLVVAKHIRETLDNHLVRIVLRTGQPGQAPEETVILDYDINDYKAKTELTAQKLFTTLVTALRSYRHVTSLASLAKATARFVPKEFLQLLQKESVVDVDLGDQVQEVMTVMFSDIRAFTNLSETMTPQENFNFINAYLRRVSPSIRAYQGFIDKYIGDEIMALFPAPADNALQAAIAMQQEIDNYNHRRLKKGYRPIKAGIGLHTGSVMLGTVGEAERMEGTVISDTVNLASRLQGLTKFYAAAIIISERTLFSLDHPTDYHFRFLDKVQVKGKQEAVSVFEIFDGNLPEIIDLKLKTRTLFEKGLLHYHSEEFNEARTFFSQVLDTNPKDKAAQLYLKRVDHFLKYGVPVNWEGIEALTEK